MKNKKKLIFLIIGIALIVFVGLYLIVNYNDKNILNSDDKKWISENGGKIIDIAVLNDIPVYANNGNGVIFDYLNFVTSETKLEFNKIPYIDNSNTFNTGYKIETVDASNKLATNQLLIYKDYYVSISKNEIKINSLNDLKGQTIGLLERDSSNINYYFENIENVKYKSYADINSLFKGMDDSEVNMVIIPHMINLDKTIKGDNYVNYFFNNIAVNIVLTLDNNNPSLNSIITKTYKYWYNNNYIADYNSTYLNYYMSMRNINDKTRADLLSKTYVYGYVENHPYEFSIASKMEGIAIEYIKRIVRLTDIDIKYQKYDSIKDLKDAINKGDVDIYFNYYNYEDSKYLKTKSTFIENYVILGKNDEIIIDNLESIKGKNVSILANNVLGEYLKASTKANISEKNSINDLVKDNLVIVDKEVYSYYKNNKFKDYEVLFTDVMKNDYTFMIKSDNENFYNLFDYFINTNSYYNYRNVAYQNFNKGLLERVTFEELYLIILAIILIPLLIFILVYVLLKNKRKIKILKRDDRKRYTDLLTSLKNRNFLNVNIEKWNQNKVYPQAIVIIDLNNTKYINDNYGREKGDMLIVKAAGILVNTQLENTEIIRSDGNEFMIYMVGYNENQVDIYTKKLSKSLQELPYGFGAAIGYSIIQDNIKSIDDAMNEATIAMQSDKESYK